MKDMLKALNDMLVKKIAGEDPGFDEFMQKFGDMFGDNPPQSLDELLEQMRAADGADAVAADIAVAASSAQQLQSLMSDSFGDPELEVGAAQAREGNGLPEPGRQPLPVPRRRGTRPRSGDAADERDARAWTS